MVSEDEIIECDDCGTEIRFGDELHKAEIKGLLKGGVKTTAITAAAVGILFGHPGAKFKVGYEILIRAGDRLGVDTEGAPDPVSVRAQNVADSTMASTMNKEYKRLEEQVEGWNWYVRMDEDGELEGPYCGDCRPE